VEPLARDERTASDGPRAIVTVGLIERALQDATTFCRVGWLPPVRFAASKGIAEVIR